MEKERKTAVITGASSGIGHAAAKLYMERGWRIITCSRGPVPDGDDQADGWISHIPTDLADADSVANFIDIASSELDGEGCFVWRPRAGSGLQQHQQRIPGGVGGRR